MKIDIAKEDLWWLRESLATAILYMESQPCPEAFSKMPYVSRNTYKKLSVAMKGRNYDKSHFPK